jgi:hypothetical protein
MVSHLALARPKKCSYRVESIQLCTTPLPSPGSVANQRQLACYVRSPMNSENALRLDCEE